MRKTENQRCCLIRRLLYNIPTANSYVRVFFLVRRQSFSLRTNVYFVPLPISLVLARDANDER